MDTKPEDIGTLNPTPKRPFVELVVISSDGHVLNTVTSENAELARLVTKLASLAESNGFPIKKLEPLMALGQDIFSIERELILMLLGALYSKTWSEIKEMPKNFPETARYTLVISY